MQNILQLIGLRFNSEFTAINEESYFDPQKTVRAKSHAIMKWTFHRFVRPVSLAKEYLHGNKNKSNGAVIPYNPHLKWDEQVHIVCLSVLVVVVGRSETPSVREKMVRSGDTIARVCIAAEYCQSILRSDDKQAVASR